MIECFVVAFLYLFSIFGGALAIITYSLKKSSFNIITNILKENKYHHLLLETKAKKFL